MLSEKKVGTNGFPKCPIRLFSILVLPLCQCLFHLVFCPGKVTPFVYFQIRIWARRPEAAEALVQQLQSEGILAESSTTVQEAVSDADIINICTGAATSILKGEWIKLGAHVNS